MKLHTIGLFTAFVLVLSACSTYSNTDWATNNPGASKTSLTNLGSLKANSVTFEHVSFKGVPAIKVEMTEAIQKGILTGAGNGNGSTFALTEALFNNGVIEVDVAGEINGKGAPDARGFVGIAFHIPEDLTTYEAIYLRMSNGTQNNPPPPAPRNMRAVQYIAHPDFHFNVSREKFPGQYEAAAPVALATWYKLRLEINGASVQVFVDNKPVLKIKDARFANRKGRIGLWVDDGTAGYFANLKVMPR